MDTMTTRERVIGNGPTQREDVRDSPTGIEESQMEKEAKIVDNSTTVENGTILIAIQNLLLFVNMVTELKPFVNLHRQNSVMVESYMKLLQQS